MGMYRYYLNSNTLDDLNAVETALWEFKWC